MMKILNADEMRAADAHAIEDLKIPSLVLMENAATCVAEVLVKRDVPPSTLAIVCGKGNNGGDGLALARILNGRGWKPKVFLLAAAEELKADPAENWSRAVRSGVRCFEKVTPESLSQRLKDCDLVVDALFGTGLTKSLEGSNAFAVEILNQSGKEIIAIDVPSGLSSDTGEVIGPCVKAEVTVALASLKYCHVFAPACGYCGETYVVDIGIPVTEGCTVNIVRSRDVASLFPKRFPDSNKGSYGHVVVIAGSTGKSGAAYMVGKAALRAGAGLVTVVTPANVQSIVASLGTEIMTKAAAGDPDFFSTEAEVDVLGFVVDKNVVALGPGMGTEEATFSLLREIVPSIDALLVIDADGLNLLSRDISILKQRKPQTTLLTPHPGEMARLLGTDVIAIQKDRIGAARRLAGETDCIVALKGFRTVVADPSGQVWIHPTGGPSMATAGTGDILTGVVAGFAAQKIPLLDAALAGVFTHGFAGNLFESKFPQQALNAMDILQYWNETVHLVRTHRNLEGEYLKLHFPVRD
jgi:ADP-dependent NAD(P)H-hydrate dehydratase / NAD(P)H-hydrate epimerase